MQTLHRSRDRLVGERTALINQLRAILLERGLVAPQGKRKLEQFLAVVMDEHAGAGFSPRMILLVADARANGPSSTGGSRFRRGVRPLAKENECPAADDDPRFAIVASALVASVGRAEAFDRGRDLSAWLGIVPRQFTTGGKPKLLGISNFQDRRRIRRLTKASLSGPLRPRIGVAPFDRRPRRLHIPRPNGRGTKSVAGRSKETS